MSDTPTKEDMARDLMADLAENGTGFPGLTAMKSACGEYECPCHDALPAAARRALHAEGRIERLEDALCRLVTAARQAANAGFTSRAANGILAEGVGHAESLLAKD